MNNSQEYGSVSEMLKGLHVEEGFANSVEDEIKNRDLATALIVLRHKAGLSQGHVAQKMGVEQGTVSKLERSTNSRLRIGDIQSYIAAVDARIAIFVMSGRPTLANQVKFHVLQIRKLLHQLAELSSKDESLIEPVGHFFGEALFNMVKSIESASEKLSGSPEQRLFTIEYVESEILGIDGTCNDPDESLDAKKSYC